MFDGWGTRKIRAQADLYAANGWPVAPLAIPRYGSCPCRKGCVDEHLVGEVVRDSARVDAVWGIPGADWGVALIAENFDVVDLPPEYGALLNHRLKATCPTAMAPVGRRWWFFMVPGSIPGEQVEAAGGVLHSGPGGWVPAPETRLETTGRIRWLVHPYLTRWRPYQRRDAVEEVFR